MKSVTPTLIAVLTAGLLAGGASPGGSAATIQRQEKRRASCSMRCQASTLKRRGRGERLTCTARSAAGSFSSNC